VHDPRCNIFLVESPATDLPAGNAIIEIAPEGIQRRVIVRMQSD